MKGMRVGRNYISAVYNNNITSGEKGQGANKVNLEELIKDHWVKTWHLYLCIAD